jgi:hypothetical protein
MVRQAGLSHAGWIWCRSCSRRATRTAAFPLSDCLVFTWVISNTCPKRRTFSAPVIALACITATAGIPAQRTIITIIRACRAAASRLVVRTRSTP